MKNTALRDRRKKNFWGLIDRVLGRISTRSCLSLALAWVFAAAVLDYYAGYHVRMAPLYLPAVFVIAWSTPLEQGLVMCLGVTAVLFSANYMAGQRYHHLLIPFWNLFARFCTYAAFYSAVWTLKRERIFALRDPMTGIANRRAMAEYASREIARCRRLKVPFTVAYLDCDNFKSLNDRWGHEAGDSLLRYVAKTLLDRMRATDLVVRLGGDEFAILLPATSTHSARRIIENLKDDLDQRLGAASCPVTMSIGVITFESAPVSLDDVLRPADRLMYDVKHAGKNRILFRSV